MLFLKISIKLFYFTFFLMFKKPVMKIGIQNYNIKKQRCFFKETSSAQKNKPCSSDAG